MPTPRQDKEDLYALLEEKERRLNEDPLNSFVPNKAQKPFIDCKKSEAWLISANRIGKTRALAYIGSRWLRKGRENPKPAMLSGGNMIWDKAVSLWISSLDFPHSRDVMQPYIFDNNFVPPGVEPFIPAREIQRWNADDQVLKLRNGSMAGYKSAESGRKKYSGAAKDGIILDEEHPRDIFDEILIRIPAGRKLYIRGGATLLPPEGNVGGVTWLYPDVIQRFLRHEDSNLEVFGGTIYDNPHLDRDEIKRLEARYPENHPERRIRLGGEWLPGLSGARAYGNFTYALNVNKSIAIQQRWPLAWFLDFNVDPMCAGVGQLLPTPNGKRIFNIYDEIIIDGGASVVMAAEEFIRRYPTHSAEVYVYGDASGHSRGQTAKSDYTLIFEVLRTYPVPVKLKVPEANPHVKDRINAMNTAFKGVAGFIGVQIHPRCTEMIADFEQVLMDPRGGIKKATNRKDPYFRRTHSSDSVGYWVSVEQPVASAQTRIMVPSKPIARPGYSFGVRA